MHSLLKRVYTCTCTCTSTCICTSTCTHETDRKSFVWQLTFNSSVLISSYGAPLAQRASYLAHYSSLFGPDGPVNYDYIVTNSINCKSNYCWPNCVVYFLIQNSWIAIVVFDSNYYDSFSHSQSSYFLCPEIK